MDYANLATLQELGRHYDSTPSLIGMAGRAEKREKGEHMQRYHGHYPQCPIGAPEPRVRGPGPTSNRATKPMHAKTKQTDAHFIPCTPQNNSLVPSGVAIC